MAKKTTAEKLQVTVVTYRWGFVIAGIVGLVLGIMILAWPKEIMWIATLALAIYAIGAGLIYTIMGIRAVDDRRAGRVSKIAAGVAFMVVGVIMVSFLGASSAVLVNMLGIMLGVLWVVEGVTALMLVRGSVSSSMATIIYAVVAVIIGVLLLLTPVWGPGMLKWMVGFGLAGLGVAQIVRAMSVPKEIKLEVEGN